MRGAVTQWRNNGGGNGVVVRYLKCRISRMFFQTGCGEHENKKLGMMFKFPALETRCGTLTDQGYSQKRNRRLECEI